MEKLCKACAKYSDKPIEEMERIKIKHRIGKGPKTCDSCNERLSEVKGAWLNSD